MIKEIASVFLKLGIVAFGGPAAHIAMMEQKIVHELKWMNKQEFLDLVGATNLIPGPNSTEMAIHCGYHRGGVFGLIVAGICFIFPAVLITLGFAWFYVKYGNIPEIQPFFYGIKPAVLAVILAAIYRLGKKALKSWQLGLIGIAVLVASLLGISEIITILIGGFVGMFLLLWSQPKETSILSFCPFILTFIGHKSKALLFAPFLAINNAVATTSLFWVFLKVGAILFGSGYVLVAYLDAELVNRLGWLTRQQLLDAIAIGQFTPGPVLSTSTFVGYQIQGLYGALWATIGIFLPSFIFVLILNPLIPKMRNSNITACFLDAVNISAVAIMIAVILKMAGEVLVNWQTISISALCMILTFGTKKIGPVWIIVIGIASGYLLHFTL